MLSKSQQILLIGELVLKIKDNEVSFVCDLALFDKYIPKRPVTCILGTGLVTCLVSNRDLELEPATVAMAISRWCLSCTPYDYLMDRI